MAKSKRAVLEELASLKREVDQSGWVVRKQKKAGRVLKGAQVRYLKAREMLAVAIADAMCEMTITYSDAKKFMSMGVD